MDIEALLEKWQARLGLSDWEITVCWRDGMDTRNRPGKATVRPAIQSADIRLMAIEDRQRCDPADADPELDLVHELIHVRLWAIEPDAPKDALYYCMEQAVEWIAKALIVSDRAQRPDTIKCDTKKGPCSCEAAHEKE